MILPQPVKNSTGSLFFYNYFDRMESKKSKKRTVFTFAQTKTPKELASYLTNLLRQNKMTDDSDNHIDRDVRRALRAALHTQDVNLLESLVKEGMDVNTIMDNVFWETPLMYTVKHGHLELMEKLLANHHCRVDYRDRNGHTALDEAVRMWLLGGAPTETKQHRGRRFRVLRCIIAAGAEQLSACFLDNVIYSCQNSRSGVTAIDKLVKLICQKGTSKLKTELFSVLLSHSKMARCLGYLLTCGADPLCFSEAVFLCQHIPEENAVVLIKGTNDERILRKVEGYVRIPRFTYEQRFVTVVPNSSLIRASSGFKAKEVIRLLLLSSHDLSLQTMQYLRTHQATLYKMAASFIGEPRPLRYLARVVVRKYCTPNVYAAVKHFRGVPLSVKMFLIFEDEDSTLGYTRK